jgi:hypothetical protein
MDSPRRSGSVTPYRYDDALGPAEASPDAPRPGPGHRRQTRDRIEVLKDTIHQMDAAAQHRMDQFMEAIQGRLDSFVQGAA